MWIIIETHIMENGFLMVEQEGDYVSQNYLVENLNIASDCKHKKI